MPLSFYFFDAALRALDLWASARLNGADRDGGTRKVERPRTMSATLCLGHRIRTKVIAARQSRVIRNARCCGNRRNLEGNGQLSPTMTLSRGDGQRRLIAVKPEMRHVCDSALVLSTIC